MDFVMAGGFGLQRCSSEAAAAAGEEGPMKEAGDACFAVEAAAGGDGGKEPPAVATKGTTTLTRLPDWEVQWVVLRESEHLASGQASPETVAASKALSADFTEHQAWMRAEYQANGGYVEVDDEFLAGRAEHRPWLEELEAAFDAIDFTGWNFSNRRSDFYEDEDDDEVEEGEDVESKFN